MDPPGELILLMIIMTSESVPCKDNPDGLMFTEEDVQIDNLRCILKGG